MTETGMKRHVSTITCIILDQQIIIQNISEWKQDLGFPLREKIMF